MWVYIVYVYARSCILVLVSVVYNCTALIIFSLIITPVYMTSVLFLFQQLKQHYNVCHFSVPFFLPLQHMLLPLHFSFVLALPLQDGWCVEMEDVHGKRKEESQERKTGEIQTSSSPSGVQVIHCFIL